MAQLKPVPGVAKVTINGSFTSGGATANIIHVDRAEFESGPWTQSELNALVTGVRASFVTRFIPQITQNWTLGVVEAVDLTSDVGLVASVSGTNTGGKSGSGLPANVAQCVTWKIPRHYRGGHPRMYLPGPTTGDTTGSSSWHATHVTAMNTACAGFLADVNGIVTGGDVPHMCCVHRYRGFTVNTTTGKKTPTQLAVPLKTYITGATFDNRIDSQRRRLGPDR